MNNWWGKGGGGAPSLTNRRHNVNSSFENPRQKWARYLIYFIYVLMHGFYFR